jgi:hypothetical protein
MVNPGKFKIGGRDGDGTGCEAGVIAAGTEGSHSLTVDITGALSNVVCFTVSKGPSASSCLVPQIRWLRLRRGAVGTATFR